MIRLIQLKNFKCYKEQEFTLTNLTVFCGNNSVGKSTAIQSLLLSLQNNFASELSFSGDFIQLGSYGDIYNKNADSEGVSVTIESDSGDVAWSSQDSSSVSLSSADDTEAIREALNIRYENNFIFLCAERWGPRTNYPYSLQRYSKKWLGINGEYTPQVLNDLTLNNLNEVFEVGDSRIHNNAVSRTLTDNLYAWMSEISPDVFIKAHTIAEADIATNQYQFGGHTYRATNVGFGLSYALPVVLSLLMAKAGGLIIIENPEAHLHPRGQSYLGRLIALTSQAGVQVIIETHSDHLLNGMRLIARVNENFNPSIFTLYYISQGEEQSTVETITLGKDGKLSNWPDGFFDQQTIDMFTIMTGVSELPVKVG